MNSRSIDCFQLTWMTLTLFIGGSWAIPVDNSVIGGPEIDCAATEIDITFNTRNNFEGHVYVKGLYDKEECRSDGTDGNKVASITLPFNSCNIARIRSLTPHGIFVTTTVVISFHPLFIIKVDRAYRVQCFYMQANKTVSTQIEVSEISTALVTQLVPMPVCRYEILDGGPTGQPIKIAIIGQQVYHKWTCDSETVDTFCAVIHSCTVDDGNGDTVEILNADGCALDKYLLNNLEYPADLMAGQEAHVYKYADRSQLFYQCQISITIKEPNSDCIRPDCPDPKGFGAQKVSGPPAPAGTLPEGRNLSASRLLKKRSALDDSNTLDVITEISALDISDDQDALLPNALKYQLSPEESYVKSTPPEFIIKHEHDGVCLSSNLLAVFCAIMTALLLIAIVYAIIVTKMDSAIGTKNWSCNDTPY